MPIYVFQCERCGVEREEIRSIREYYDPPPHDPSETCPEADPIGDIADIENYADAEGNVRTTIPCRFVQRPTTFTQRWPHGVESNEGRGGWEKQPGGMMIKRTSGKEKTKYGEGA